MRTKFTYGNVMLGIMGLVVIFITTELPSAIDCKSDTDCTKSFQSLGVIGFVIGLITMILGVFIPFFKSIGPKEIRDQLAEESGPTHDTLPKGFDNTSQKESTN